MLNKVLIGLLIVLACLSTGCESDPFPVSSGNGPAVNRKLVISTTFIDSDSLNLGERILSDVSVKMYTSADERDWQLNRVKEGIADSAGDLTFEYLKAIEYFIAAEHPDYDSLVYEEINLSTQSATAFVDLVFVK